jgi:hypothetical protein
MNKIQMDSKQLIKVKICFNKFKILNLILNKILNLKFI